MVVVLFWKFPMRPKPECPAESPPVNPIRVETAFSRYPVHHLAKRGSRCIVIKESDDRGEVVLNWEVSHNPGPLAYKLDTLVINRRIEEASRPVPRVIRLGSLREITEELGLTTHNNAIKQALHKNASTYIRAKIKYKLADGAEQDLEAGFTRYSVIFTGEKLPNGKKADAVHIVLNDIFMQVINGAMTRPLDYGYLKSLPPAPQRFYELLSYQMYAAVKHDRVRAKLTYSTLCTYSPQARYLDWERVRKQMAKVHAPHKKSGYIGAIEFQETTDGEGRPDWVMLYQPGPKARAEFRAFTKRGGPTVVEVESFADALPTPAAAEPSPLERELTERGVTAATAADLVRGYAAEEIRGQIEILEWLTAKEPDKITEPAAYLVTAIKRGHAKPRGFTTAAERQRREEAKRQKQEADAGERRRKHEVDVGERAEVKAADAFIKRLKPKGLAALEAEALAAAGAEVRASYNSPAMKPFRASFLRGILRDHVRAMIKTRTPNSAEE